MSANGTQEKLLASIGDKVAAVITPMMVAIAMLDTKLEAITFRLDTFDEMMGPKCKTDTLEKKQVADGGDAPVTSAPARARSKKAATPAAVPAAVPASDFASDASDAEVTEAEEEEGKEEEQQLQLHLQ